MVSAGAVWCAPRVRSDPDHGTGAEWASERTQAWPRPNEPDARSKPCDLCARTNPSRARTPNEPEHARLLQYARTSEEARRNMREAIQPHVARAARPPRTGAGVPANPDAEPCLGPVGARCPRSHSLPALRAPLSPGDGATDSQGLMDQTSKRSGDWLIAVSDGRGFGQDQAPLRKFL
jgi:hypothetical protein